MIDLEPEYLEMVKKILTEYVPEYDVYAFGSRVTGRSWKFSDLDLVIMTDKRMTLSQYGRLREAFSESDIPIKVDVVDWAAAKDNFRAIIQKQMELIQLG